MLLSQNSGVLQAPRGSPLSVSWDRVLRDSTLIGIQQFFFFKANPGGSLLWPAFAFQSHQDWGEKGVEPPLVLFRTGPGRDLVVYFPVKFRSHLLGARGSWLSPREDRGVSWGPPFNPSWLRNQISLSFWQILWSGAWERSLTSSQATLGTRGYRTLRTL